MYFGKKYKNFDCNIISYSIAILYCDLIKLLSYTFMVIMSNSIQKCLFDIPDEILEDNLFTLLSFGDLMNLMNIGNARLYRCCNAVVKKTPIDSKLL